MSVRTKQQIRQRLHERIRKKIRGSGERPRLAVHRSEAHIYAQLIDDDLGRTLVAASSRDKDVRAKLKSGGNVAAAKEVGGLVAARAKSKGIEKVVFDRGGFQYHGRIKALAEAARAAGLKF
jgi:large subunit ribosomal protein L18